MLENRKIQAILYTVCIQFSDHLMAVTESFQEHNRLA